MKKILIVEDEEALREVYKTLFTFEKFKVYEAINGQDAIDQLKKITPDVILLDILMPVMNGIEFLEESQYAKAHPEVKILVLSNLSDPKTLKKITNAGATKYLLKSSASPSELVTTVRDMLATA